MPIRFRLVTIAAAVVACIGIMEISITYSNDKLERLVSEIDRAYRQLGAIEKVERIVLHLTLGSMEMLASSEKGHIRADLLTEMAHSGSRLQESLHELERLASTESDGQLTGAIVDLCNRYETFLFRKIPVMVMERSVTGAITGIDGDNAAILSALDRQVSRFRTALDSRLDTTKEEMHNEMGAAAWMRRASVAGGTTVVFIMFYSICNILVRRRALEATLNDLGGKQCERA